MNLNDRKSIQYWDKFREQMKKATFINPTETAAEQKKRIERLEADHEAWFKYYFPNYYKSDAAPFHKNATKRWMNNDRWYEVRAWSRENAKSTRAMMEDLKLMLTKKATLKL